MGVSEGDLRALYATTDDPWDFRRSEYERGRLAATERALARDRYSSALEIGCGNGELARRLAPRCAAYIGLDAVPIALEAARSAVPEARFVRGYLPCDLPKGAHDLIVLSEVLYFLDRAGIAALAGQIDRRWPGAEIVVVTWLGPTGHALDGSSALAAFSNASLRSWAPVHATDGGYRIDQFDPLIGAAR